MVYRVQYLHQNTGEIASFDPMSREDALEVARQLTFDGEKEVQIVDDTGRTFFSVQSLAGS